MRTVTRHRERASAEREVLNQILDDGMVGTLSTVTDDGMPWAVPLLYARDGDRILVHGSTGAGALRRVATGAPVAFSVTHMDAMVVAHSTFESSANYRSAVVYGVFEALSGDEQYSALRAPHPRPHLRGAPDDRQGAGRHLVHATAHRRRRVGDQGPQRLVR